MRTSAWRTAGLISAGVWTYLAFFRGGFWRLRERLEAPRPSSGPERTHKVTAVIPARDEEDTIGRTVASLRGQVFDGELRVIVADDESEDATSSEAIRNGAVAVRVSARPRGWKGKLWAVASGIKADRTNPDFFLLTDADIEYSDTRAIAGLIAQASYGYDLASIMVRLRCESAAEKFLIPAFVFFFFMLYPPAWVASGSAPAAAAGGCMLIRRDMLERIGGIESIRNAMIDDCALAQRVRAAGGRVWLGICDLPVRSIRPYDNSGVIRAMISRSAFAQLRHSTLLLAGTIAGMAITYLAPVALLFAPDRLTKALGAASWLASAALFWPTVRIYRAPRWTVFCLPAISAFYVAATLESALLYWSGKGGEWKGRIQDSAASDAVAPLPSASH